MLRQIRFDKYPVKSQSFRPQILHPLLLLQRHPYDFNTHKFSVFDNQYQMNYILYVTRKLNEQVQANIQFIQHVPNILILKYQPYSLIFEQQFTQTLKEYLFKRQTQRGLPFVNQIQAKDILKDIFQPLESFQKNNINYQTLHDNNIVRLKGQWTLSLAGILSNGYLKDKNFFDSKRKDKESLIYALGSLLFKMLFGFVPYQQNPKKPQQFKFSTYINYLEEQNVKKMLKIYYFADRIQMISNNCKLLIEQCLSGKIATLQQFKKHPFFTSPPQSPKKQTLQSRQIKMISYFGKAHQSLIMASIDRRKKNPYQKIHQKIQSDIAGYLQLQQSYKKDVFLCHLKFASTKPQSELKRQQQTYDNLKIDCQYFGRQFDVKQEQRPTLQLIKLIESDKQKYPDLYKKQDRQSKIKLYAFPYVMVFQLANVYYDQGQTIQIKKKIQQLIPLLLEVSSMHWPVDKFICLHNTPIKKTKFEDLKIKYRQLINFLYKSFLNQAMKRYNAKKQNLQRTQKLKLKYEGLAYYKLCLKLMEVSLIVRKGGKDLDLQRIQTSERKQIQYDLESLLKTYFPNRVQIK